MENFKKILGRVASGERLDIPAAREAFDIMMSGNATPSQMGAFLMALRVRGETVDEITGGAMIMRAKALHIDAPANAVDTCGTGGDASGTWNISTGAGLVVAACGIPVAKHGNRALSSKTGAADVLAALGVNIECEFSLVRRCIWEANFGFLMAPRHHSATRQVAPTRVELGTRTIFNLLGPLSNPAGAKRQLLGAFGRQWIRPMAETLRNLGSERVWVVHGSDGLDEITTTGPTYVAELRQGNVTEFAIAPGDAGIPEARPDDLKGADAATNALALTALLDGHHGPYRDIVLLNAAAALVVAEKATDLRVGVALAAKAIDSGNAKKILKQVINITNEPVS